MALTNEETPKNEENAPPESPKSQKDGWDRSDIVAKWVSAVGTPLVIGVGSWLIQKSISEQSAQIQKSIAEQSLAKDYVGFAINIVDRLRQEGDDDLREWATNLLVHHAPKEDEFNPKAQEQLKRLERLEYAGLQGYDLQNVRFENSFSPNGKKAAAIEVVFGHFPHGITILSASMTFRTFRTREKSQLLMPVWSSIFLDSSGPEIA